MKDSEARGIVLRALYEVRHTEVNPGIPADVPGLEQLQPRVLLNVVEQLKEQGLVSFQRLAGGDGFFGRGKITSFGVDIIEGGRTSPIAISIDQSVNVNSSQNVMVGGSGNTQAVTMDIEKLFNAVDGSEASVAEKAEAKSLLQKVFDNPLAKAALDWFAKGKVGSN